MKILVLGGTSFLGRAYVTDLLDRGHEVTTFNRGRSGPDQPGVEAVRGDRDSPADLERLVADRRWDAVVDTSPQQPHSVALSTRLLEPRTGHYTLVSSVHAYADWGSVPIDEDSTRHPCPADTPADQPSGNHLKAGCERALLERFGADRSLILNCGLLIGPHENTGRLPWWLDRIARGGRVLAPGEPGRGIQAIDARDLAAFGRDRLEQGAAGRYLTTSPIGAATFGDLLTACVDATGSGAELSWTDEAVLLAAEVQPWTELPVWAPDLPDWSAIWQVDTSRARRAGLRCRPIAETVRDTWAWMRERGPATEPYRQGGTVLGIAPEKERGLLSGTG
ncbi:NAD-dependent epimerase/dehydratase family protein [Streptacidiphilus sp. P02-A3a]|uniref:NAD-dependent epimerase/dehydratase family protein n=1 Tax=Streptacidiphilus sp. P02-A3a TaxID=2704468 RepID=UPI0015F93F92|nr:NAD-dependent epimerase/dehydratase family protein [Streptacidiphilus sp. P02-A3a]QMU69582.1 NAD-dependent epimerase/dehydratase family protein [Streptacidiphilus sp. P02-A3a]